MRLPQPVEIEGIDEIVSAIEISESETALQDYWAGQDSGITPTALKKNLFGDNLG